ncbi:MAG: hypothetical protein HY909_05875 [Deltaproteobacteria bacterium]|nr:hypothetical protein [Deltaproteobacteria bacterium]
MSARVTTQRAGLRRRALLLALAGAGLAACRRGPSATARRARPQPFEPVDESFRGCEGG